jgi:cysteine desulfurase / selenocysteine lyase
MTLDLNKIHNDFPILDRLIHGKRLAYLDSAATTLKPKVVSDAMENYYSMQTSNIHRGVHTLSEEGTTLYESAREKVRSFIGASSTEEIIITKGTTDSINIVAQSLGQDYFKEGDEVIITHMEHHSNIVPWQMLRDSMGLVLKVATMNEHGELDLNHLDSLITPKTKLISLVYVSNSLGTINPVKTVIDLAHSQDIPVLVDGAQAVSHIPIDVTSLDCDFFIFSAHKLFGPTGVGTLYGKKAWLDKMPPVAGGGDMILSVTFEKTLYNTLPYKFEAGTPHIGGVIGMGIAIDYVLDLGLENIDRYEHELLDYGTSQLQTINELKLIGTAKNKTSILSFTLDPVHPHDIGSILDQEGVAIRTGHHCTQPVMQFFGIPATARASLAFYNTKEDIDQLVSALHKAKEIFS